MTIAATADPDHQLRTMWRNGTPVLMICRRLGITLHFLAEKKAALHLQPRAKDAGRSNLDRRLDIARARLPALWASPNLLPKIGQRLKVSRADLLSLAAELSLDISLKTLAEPMATAVSGDHPRSIDLATPIARPMTCQWPVGDPREPDFQLCGAARERGSYCASHHVMAYRQPRQAD